MAIVRCKKAAGESSDMRKPGVSVGPLNSSNLTRSTLQWVRSEDALEPHPDEFELTKLKKDGEKAISAIHGERRGVERGNSPHGE